MVGAAETVVSPDVGVWIDGGHIKYLIWDQEFGTGSLGIY